MQETILACVWYGVKNLENVKGMNLKGEVSRGERLRCLVRDAKF